MWFQEESHIWIFSGQKLDTFWSMLRDQPLLIAPGSPHSGSGRWHPPPSLHLSQWWIRETSARVTGWPIQPSLDHTQCQESSPEKHSPVRLAVTFTISVLDKHWRAIATKLNASIKSMLLNFFWLQPKLPSPG